MLMVLLEGPDGAGKSTLAAELARVMDLEVHREGPPPPGTETLLWHYADAVTRARSQAHRNMRAGVALDRSALSEMIYGPVLRGVSRISPQDWLSLYNGMREVGLVSVMCLPSLETTLGSWRQRRDRELLADEGQVATVWCAYRKELTDNPARWDAVVNRDVQHAGARAVEQVTEMARALAGRRKP